MDTLSNEKRLKHITANYWKRHHLLPPQEITADCRHAELNRQQQIISYHGCRVCVINDNRWRNKSTVSPLYIQYLYLCKGYDGHLEELAQVFSFSYVILDASLSEYRKHLLESECKKSGLRFISLSDEGSVRFCSKYKDLSYICTLIKFKSMLTKVIEQAKIDHFTKWFERADKIVIVSHVSPDGDAIGSSLGLYHFLDSQEKQ